MFEEYVKKKKHLSYQIAGRVYARTRCTLFSGAESGYYNLCGTGLCGHVVSCFYHGTDHHRVVPNLVQNRGKKKSQEFPGIFPRNWKVWCFDAVFQASHVL